MFTGIVRGVGRVERLELKQGALYYAIRLPEELALRPIEIGSSIAIDGVCMTVTRTEDAQVHFVAMEETLARTTLGNLSLGQEVNVERSVAMGDEIGGHLLSGHIMATAQIAQIQDLGGSRVWKLRVPVSLTKYLFEKGYVALDGASLTVVSISSDELLVSLIPHTLEVTTFHQKQVGDRLNLEIDSQTQAVVDTVERYMSQANENK